MALNTQPITACPPSGFNSKAKVESRYCTNFTDITEILQYESIRLGYLQNEGIGAVVFPDSRLISLLVELGNVVVDIQHVNPDCGVVKYVVAGCCCYDDQPMASRRLVVEKVRVGHSYQSCNIHTPHCVNVNFAFSSSHSMQLQ